MPRGGRRSGANGKNYGNRSDLRTAHPLPIQTAPGQAYGTATAQAAAQAAVPEASGALPQNGTGPQLPDATADASQFSGPSTPVVPLGAPSMNPQEPVTAGIGQQGTTTPGADPLLRGVALLNALGSGASPEVNVLRNVVGALQANSAIS